VNAIINVLYVSASAADEKVLKTLVAGDESASAVRLVLAPTAQAFFDALYSEESYQVAVVDDQQPWSDWQSVIAALCKGRPNALQVLLVDTDHPERQAQALAEGLAVVYPRNSAGLVALTTLLSKLAARDQSFSLRRELREPDGDEVEDGEEEREKLVYAVSHDLQDPLQLARRYAEILNDDFEKELGDSGSNVLGHLQFNLSRTQEMLDELLDYSRLQNMQVDREVVDLNELLDEVRDLYRLTLEELGGQIVCQQPLPTLKVDRRQFQRLFQNLIGNAIKFRGDSPLQITVRSQRVRDEWRIGIKDNGVGIAEEDIQRIFDMFERAGVAEDQPGTGMGLAICKRIVQNHGGSIWARSNPSGGSVFIFSVPQTDESTEGPTD